MNKVCCSSAQLRINAIIEIFFPTAKIIKSDLSPCYVWPEEENFIRNSKSQNGWEKFAKPLWL